MFIDERNEELNKRQLGQHFEEVACRYLQRQGLVLVAKNQSCRQGEIDLVMNQDNVWVFVEVRYRKSHFFGGAVLSVDQKKRKRLYHAAMYWLQQNRLNHHSISFRFDLIAIQGHASLKSDADLGFNIEWIQNIIDGD